MASERLEKIRFYQQVGELSRSHGSFFGFPWAALLLVLLFGAAEWYYSPLETTLGEFMRLVKDTRPMTGQGWEWNENENLARQKLHEIGKQLDSQRAAVSSLSSFLEVPGLLERDRAIVLSKNKFLQLYLKLPAYFRESLIPSLDLFRLKSYGKWHRVFLTSDDSGTSMYIVDSKNVVLLANSVPDLFFERLTRSQNPEAGSLQDDPRFNGRWFRAELFFSVVASGDSQLKKSIDTVWLLRQDGELARVGVSSSVDPDNQVEIVFEFKTTNGTRSCFSWLEANLGESLFQEMMARSFQVEML